MTKLVEIYDGINKTNEDGLGEATDTSGEYE
jgi:hypothetical protein